ncbi:MAG: hypothetical protein ACLR7U_12600 [Ruthenibacterium lactatiformans]
MVCGLVRHRLPMRYESRAIPKGVVLGPHYTNGAHGFQYPAGDDAVELVPLRPVHRERQGD